MMSSKKIYFASDFHLGVPDKKSSHEREKLICQWLDEIKQDAEKIFLVGDIFDFWFEYRYTIPKGFVRLLGKLAELSDAGITIEIFTGNHDMWIKNYLSEELNIIIHHQPIIQEFYGKKFLIGHGDGLGPGDFRYKILKKIFQNKICQWLYARLHPNFAFMLANYLSRKSRASTGSHDEKFLGKEKEWLYLYCSDFLKQEPIDYFIFGHRHLPLNIKIGEKSQYINLGDWLKYNTYAYFDGATLILQDYPKKQIISSELVS